MQSDMSEVGDIVVVGADQVGLLTARAPGHYGFSMRTEFDLRGATHFPALEHPRFVDEDVHPLDRVSAPETAGSGAAINQLLRPGCGRGQLRHVCRKPLRMSRPELRQRLAVVDERTEGRVGVIAAAQRVD